ncbi:MAG: hypothetical protein JWR40_4351 [Massilia sp.]|jgi:hypothetical protein|nr:hypothetical protein [Massilia sp.]MDB5949141.1 hypothetical protein [Massilia sp.]
MMFPKVCPKSMLILAVAAVCASACSRADKPADAGIRKTAFPGMVTAGGGTSGEVLARSAKPVTDGSYAGGTPGIAGGAGGTSGGTATGGTVQESGQGPSGNTAPPAAKQTPSGQ